MIVGLPPLLPLSPSQSPVSVFFVCFFTFFCACLLQVQTLNEQEWERMQQANVLANVAQAFESDMDASDLDEDRETIFSSVDLLSPGGQADAQTLALMLQEQLDAINNEIR